MPIYEYQCQACGHHFEAIQRISDSPLKDCPSCEAPQVRKLVSAAAFHLKGTGWYETDFKNKGKPAAGGDKAGEKKDGVKSDKTAGESAKSDSATKSAPKSTSTESSTANKSTD